VSVVFNLWRPLGLTQSCEVDLRNDESPMDGNSAQPAKGLRGVLKASTF
jgi:hypothetical protein